MPVPEELSVLVPEPAPEPEVSGNFTTPNWLPPNSPVMTARCEPGATASPEIPAPEVIKLVNSIIAEAVEEVLPRIEKQAASAKLPAELRHLIEAELQDHPELSWDAAVSKVVKDLDLGSLR